MLISSDAAQALLTITQTRTVLDGVVVRGVRAVAGEQLRELTSLSAEMQRIGASHIAALLATLADQIERGDRGAAATLMTALSHTRMLDRLLTLRAADAIYKASVGDEHG